MIAREVPVQLFLPKPKTPRSVGIHVSGIIRAIATESGILKPEWAEEISLVDVRTITDPVAITRICIGLAWEEWYIPNILAKEGVIDHPGEYKVDGVYMTPDGESLSVIITQTVRKHVVKVHEVKATYKSTNTVGDLEKQWMWNSQIKCYCKAVCTTHAKIHVLFLCGDYSYPITPITKAWDIEYTQEEIEDNWQLMVDYKNEKLGV